MITKIIKFKGIDCANCAAKLERKLNKIKGVTATVNFITGKMMLELDSEELMNDVTTICLKLEPDMKMIWLDN